MIFQIRGRLKCKLSEIDEKKKRPHEIKDVLQKLSNFQSPSGREIPSFPKKIFGMMQEFLSTLLQALRAVRGSTV